MPFHLIRRDGEFPPGGYAFTDPKTGQSFNGMEATFDEQVGRIIRHRRGNPNVYPPGSNLDFASVANELDAHQCLRLGNNPRLCTDGSPVTHMSPAAPLPGAPACPACKQPMQPRYCPTCSSRRLIGWECDKCKTVVNA